MPDESGPLSPPVVTAHDLTVSGGAGGTEADLADLGVLAGRSADLAMELGSISAAAHALLVDPDLLASAALDPGGAAAFEAALLVALDGPSGLTALAARLGMRAAAVTTVRAGYEAADAVQAELMSAREWYEGVSALQHLQMIAMGLGPAASAFMSPASSLDPDHWQLYTDPERWLTEHPGEIDDFLNSLPGMTGHGPSTSWQELLGELSAGFPDGTYELTGQVEAPPPEMTNPPLGYRDLLAGLNYRDSLAVRGNDEIDVRIVTQPDGTTAYIVDIPGTKDSSLPIPDLTVGPVTVDLPNDSVDPATGLIPNSNDMTTNALTLAGQTTARELAIAEALRRAGASPTDPVMLVGHSQGGMVAAQAAADTADGTFGYNVTHVLTAGSPVALADVPPDVQVLSLENEHDIVAHLDGAENPASPNHTTVSFAYQAGSIGGNHQLSVGYLDAAAALDSTYSPSVDAFTDSAAPFLADPGGGTTVRADVFNIERVPE